MVAVRINTIAVRVAVQLAQLAQLTVQLVHQAGGQCTAVRLRAAAVRLVHTEAAQTALAGVTVAPVLGQTRPVMAVSLVESGAVQAVQVAVDQVEQATGVVQNGRLTLLSRSLLIGGLKIWLLSGRMVKENGR